MRSAMSSSWEMMSMSESVLPSPSTSMDSESEMSPDDFFSARKYISISFSQQREA